MDIEDLYKMIRELLNTRYSLQADLNKIPDEHLPIIYMKIGFITDRHFMDSYFEYHSTYILTADKTEFEEHREKMCCGIYTDEIDVGDTTYYFGFDYGH